MLDRPEFWASDGGITHPEPCTDRRAGRDRRAGQPVLPVPHIPGGAAQAPGLQVRTRLRPRAATWSRPPATTESTCVKRRLASPPEAGWSLRQRLYVQKSCHHALLSPQMASRLVCDQKTLRAKARINRHRPGLGVAQTAMSRQHYHCPVAPN